MKRCASTWIAIAIAIAVALSVTSVCGGSSMGSFPTGAMSQLGAEPQDPQACIQHQYDRFAAAYIKNDVETMIDILTTDYRLQPSSKKTLNLAQYRSILEARRDRNDHVDRYTVLIRNFHKTHSGADVESEETAVINDRQGQPLSTQIHRYADSWVKRGEAWKLRLSRTIEER